MFRNGNAVCWEMDGLVASVACDGNAGVRATFSGNATRDTISASNVTPMYRSESSYRLTSDGVSRLSADLAAFFSGTREPRFTFTGFRHELYVGA